MADHEQLEKLKQSVEEWNAWRAASTEIQINLREVNLSYANLSEADLSGANLSGADLGGAVLRGADLGGAVLREADLYFANLSHARLREANFTKAKVGWTNFNNINLETVKGLETVHHEGPSYLDYYTFVNSHGNIPEQFLLGAGLSDTFIEYIHSIVDQPINYYSCFISYSSKDSDFARRLYNDLQGNNVRCWYAPEHMKIGSKMRENIDTSIRLYDRLLIVLSEHSVESVWVEHEVETALDKEREGKPNVLFPVRIDDTVISKKTGWANHIRNTRHIGDFTNWKEHDAYQQAFQRLLRDLKQEP